MARIMNRRHFPQVAFAVAASYAIIALGIVYIGLIAWGIGTQDSYAGEIRDSIRIPMEIATILTSLVFLLFAVSLHQLTRQENRTLSLFGVLLMLALVVLTCLSHFISISVGKSLMTIDTSFSFIVSLSWPSILLAVDILAWDVFFGLAFISLGISHLPNKTSTIPSILMIVSGILSLVGLIALPLNNMNVRFIGIFGYTVMPVISCISFLMTRKNIDLGSSYTQDGQHQE